VYALNGGQIFTKTRTTEVRRVDLSGRAIFIKKYWVTKASQIVSGATRGTLFGKSKVRREYENLVWLRTHGFCAPAPVAYGEERRAGCLARSCLISEAVTARPLEPQHDWLSLADFLRELHAKHFFHCDLFWRNILVAGNRFYLIDAHKGGYQRGSI